VSDARRLVRILEARAEMALRVLAFELAHRMAELTPEDDGRAQAGWNITQGSPRFEDPGEGSYPKGTGDVDPKFKMQASRLTLEGGNVFITNGVPYIRKLEYGKAKAGRGGVARTQYFMRWTTGREVRGLGRLTAKKVRRKRVFMERKRRTGKQRVRASGFFSEGSNPFF
jgi:hypothetical protein